MTTIFLKDTGKYSTSSSDAITGASNLANNGTEIPLKIRNMRFAVGLSFDNSPAPGSITVPKLGFVSFSSPTIVLTGHINKDVLVNDTTSVINKINGGTPSLYDETGTSFTEEVKMLGLLYHASKTKGYKELYYKDASAYNTFYGIATDYESSGTYKCFYVRIKGFDLTESPDSRLIQWNCTLEVTS